MHNIVFFIFKRLFSPLLPTTPRRFDVYRVVFVRGGKTKRTNLDAFRSVGVGEKNPRKQWPPPPPLAPLPVPTRPKNCFGRAHNGPKTGGKHNTGTCDVHDFRAVRPTRVSRRRIMGAALCTGTRKQ